MDTLWLEGAFQIHPYDIAGTSVNNVWIAAYADVNMGSLWHYDGVSWTNSMTPADEWDGRGPVDLQDIQVVSLSSVWFVGSRYTSNAPGQIESWGFIMEWNGTTYQEHTDTAITKGPGLTSIWGSDRNQLFAVGLEGRKLRFDGSAWSVLDTDSVWYNRVYGVGSQEIYALGYEADRYQPFDSTRWVIAQWDGSQFITASSYVQTPISGSPPWGVYDLLSIENTLYSCGHGVFRRGLGGWQEVMNTFYALNAIAATNSSNILAVGSGSQVLHWNGQDWQALTIPILKSSVMWTGVYLGETSVMIAGTDGTRGLVLIGK